MKKIYSSPEMEIEKFTVEGCVFTTSGEDLPDTEF